MIDMARKTFAKYGEDDIPILAAALAYYTVFSLAPLLIVVIAVLVFFGQGNAQSAIFDQVRSLLGANGAELVRTMIENRQAAGGNILATVIGVVVLVFGATGVFAQLQKALNIIWGVEPDPDAGGGLRHLVVVRLLSLGMILVIGFLLLVSLVLTAVLEGLVASAGDVLPGADVLWMIVNLVVSLAVISLLFALMFRYLPDVEIAWNTVWVGAVVTALLFTVGKWALGFYLSTAAVASSYGAAGSLVVLLLWVFYSAQIVLLGAAFTQVWGRRSGDPIEPAEHAVRS